MLQRLQGLERSSGSRSVHSSVLRQAAGRLSADFADDRSLLGPILPRPFDASKQHRRRHSCGMVCYSSKLRSQVVPVGAANSPVSASFGEPEERPATAMAGREPA